MSPFSRGLGLAVLLCANAGAAEHDWPAAPRAPGTEERVRLSIRSRAGLAEAPFITAAFPEVSGFGVLLTGTAAVRLSSAGWLRARVPWSIVQLDFPAGAQVSQTALGNLELGLERAIELRPATRLGVVAALFAPTAEQGPRNAWLHHRALALTSALTGGRDSPLSIPGVSGGRLGASVEHSQGHFDFRASLDVSVLVRLSDARLPEETETHSVGILAALDGRAASWITSWFGASLGVELSAAPLRVEEPIRERDRKRRLQPAAEPGVHARWGQHVVFDLDARIPLGGNAWSIGSQVRLGF